jgi:MerR family transcriptional regulator, light-induced transcriptional regulator
MDNVHQVFALRGLSDGAESTHRDSPLGGRSWGARDPDRSVREERAAWLARAIEGEIIPRLMLLHQAPATDTARPEAAGLVLSADEVVAFAKLLLRQDLATVREYVGDLCRKGLSFEEFFLDLLGPSARCLGEMWSDDQCTFADVTVGLGQLQRLMHDVTPCFEGGMDYNPYASRGKRVLFSTLAQEQHIFGLVMVAEFFNRGGWDVWGEPPRDHATLKHVVSTQWFDVIGFSLGFEEHAPALAAEIRMVREVSRNRDVAIMVGGPLLSLKPELARLLGADATATNGTEALARAEQLLKLAGANGDVRA